MKKSEASQGQSASELISKRIAELDAQAHQGSRPGRRRGVEVDGHSDLVARRHHLHWQILQECREAYLLQGRVSEGSGPSLQLESRRKRTAGAVRWIARRLATDAAGPAAVVDDDQWSECTRPKICTPSPPLGANSIGPASAQRPTSPPLAAANGLPSFYRCQRDSPSARQLRQHPAQTPSAPACVHPPLCALSPTARQHSLNPPAIRSPARFPNPMWDPR